MPPDTDDDHYQVAVIGGGAAGYFGAITCAELASEPRHIVILEKGSKVLQKVKISGGGRCNVTHDLHDLREFATRYPRGHRTLPGPLHAWSPSDMIDWLADRGVQLKTEADGRMFPVTDDSQTIIQTFLREATSHDVEIQRRAKVERLAFDDHSQHFQIEIANRRPITADRVLLSTGGIRTPAGADFASAFGHTIQPAAPSLFTFRITDPRLEDLAGVSVTEAVASIPGTKFREAGPVLVTHWGLSGPGILRLSAQAARDLQEKEYRFPVEINWVGGRRPEQIREELQSIRNSSGRKSIQSQGQFQIPGRLWKRLCTAAEIPADLKWANAGKQHLAALSVQLSACPFDVMGKSMNKDEFVTCGGVALSEINFKTMESKLQPGLFFAGEILDIDGVTGGFNFQSAWTTARIAGTALSS